MYLGYVGLTWAFASAIGPVLGGVFTEKVTWRLCFWINLPIGIVAILGLVIFLHLESPKVTVFEGLKRVDWLGRLLNALIKRWQFTELCWRDHPNRVRNCALLARPGIRRCIVSLGLVPGAFLLDIWTGFGWCFSLRGVEGCQDAYHAFEALQSSD